MHEERRSILDSVVESQNEQEIKTKDQKRTN